MTKTRYHQNWPALNRAQVSEKSDLPPLLHDLCAGVAELPQSSGRPRLPIADMLFCMTLKVYCMVSCRRFMPDLKIAYERGFISRLPSYNSIFTYFGMSVLRSYLVQLIIESSLPLKSVEKCFSVDSTGFSTCRFGLWVDARFGRSKTTDKRKWVKAHLMCGVLTNIVTAVEVTKATAGDSPYFVPLLETTTQNFDAEEVSADKAYSSLVNLKFARSKRVMPFIPFKVNAKPGHGTADPIWTRLYHFYSYNQEWFSEHYHKRSNSESTNAMIKMKFGERLRSKTEVAQFNELLCKVLCHNICVTIQSTYELGIQPTFWNHGEKKAA
jgi:Transposase DDE domain